MNVLWCNKHGEVLRARSQEPFTNSTNRHHPHRRTKKNCFRCIFFFARPESSIFFCLFVYSASPQIGITTVLNGKYGIYASYTYINVTFNVYKIIIIMNYYSYGLHLNEDWEKNWRTSNITRHTLDRQIYSKYWINACKSRFSIPDPR